jgi:hypothetical protein
VTDAVDLPPIEPHLREEGLVDNDTLVVRAGPLIAQKLLEHALRQQRDYSYRGSPMASISVAATVSGWSVDRILQELLWSRSNYATSTAGALRDAGYELLPTHSVPHYDVLLPSATLEDAGRLLELFSAGQPNPFRRRTR